jgi:transcriptional regulator with XRE-family HTH domain
VTEQLISHDPSPVVSGVVGERIADARHAAGLTQRDLASEIGTSAWVVQEFELGRRDPGDLAARIESATLKPPGWLRESAGLSSPLPDVRSVDRPLSPIERFDRNLVLGVFALILVIRFFTESIGVLPSAGNFIDVFLLPILLMTVAVRPTQNSHGLPRASPYAVAGVAFLGVCVISVAVNTSRVAPAPSLLFIYDFLGPLVFYYATYRLWPAGQASVLTKLILSLGILQFVTVGLIDLPGFLSSRNPDDITGTFGGNAYQLVFFLLVFAALVAGISTFETQRRVARFAPLIFVATFLVIFLAQYRALLVSTALTILLLGAVLSSTRGKGFLVGTAVIVAFVGGLEYVSARYPGFKFAATVQAVRNDPLLFVTARLAPGRDVISLYSDNPRFIVTGTGPGTYSSRAWRTFAEVANPTHTQSAAQPYANALTGGHVYHTDVADKYVLPRIKTAAVVLGSKAVTSPYSSYLALLAEVGVFGFVLMVGIYIRAMKHASSVMRTSLRSATGHDPLPALALATMVAFFLLLQMAFLENWWEAARVTVPSWMMLAVCAKEFAARSGSRSPS